MTGGWRPKADIYNADVGGSSPPIVTNPIDQSSLNLFISIDDLQVSDGEQYHLTGDRAE